METAIDTLVQRLEKVTQRLESVEKKLEQGGGATAAPAASSASGGDSSASVSEYEGLIQQYITPFVDLSTKIANASNDKFLSEQAALVLQAVNLQKELLKIAASCQKPTDATGLLTPINELMQKIITLRDSNRSSKLFNHLSTISEGIAALGWVVVAPTPGPYVADMRAGSEFYSNRVLKDFKGKDQMQVDWVNAFNGFLKDLQAFIKKNHTTGLVWNASGGPAPSSLPGASSSAPPPPSGGAPPPPGPPPPAPVVTDAGPGGPDMSGVFAAISKGTEITSGLKKVTKDMKTKNRTDKSSVVPASTSTKSTTSAPKAAAKVSKPPKFALEGNKWVVEFQSGNRNIVISETEPKHVVYVYKCDNCTIQVKGKVNAITLDDCTKTAVVFDNVVASFEVVNCRSIETQVVGTVPSFAVDKTSGCQIYLSKDALNTEIVTSKSSEMNVLIPGSGPDADLVEMPIPEQYKTTVQKGKLHTEIVQHV